MKKATRYICNKCHNEFSEDERTNVRGRLWIESAGRGEKEIEVNFDLCPECRDVMLEAGQVNVPIIENFGVEFESR